MLRLIALSSIAFIGFIGVIVFGYNALIDWDALQQAYIKFAKISKSSPDMTTLFIAETQQNIHRINLFAEGVWTLQSAILGSLGVHGLCIRSRK
ncbi:Cobalt transporter [Tumidithrix helvetica PCC 7403]|uniref:hypothetical protein n=1 Tax=Tumidithrix helvetica TaxID=3457545 RepID=UPI003CBD7B40